MDLSVEQANLMPPVCPFCKHGVYNARALVEKADGTSVIACGSCYEIACLEGTARQTLGFIDTTEKKSSKKKPSLKKPCLKKPSLKMKATRKRQYGVVSRKPVILCVDILAGEDAKTPWQTRTPWQAGRWRQGQEAHRL